MMKEATPYNLLNAGIGHAQRDYHPLTKIERDYAKMNINGFWKDCINLFVKGAKSNYSVGFKMGLTQSIDEDNFFYYRLSSVDSNSWGGGDVEPCVNIRLFLPEMPKHKFARRNVEAWGYDRIIIATSIMEANSIINRLRKPFSNDWLSVDRGESIKKCPCGIIHKNPGQYCHECNGETKTGRKISDNDGQHLYFMTDGYKIKIGRSKHPNKRARQISTQVGETVSVIKTIKNCGDYEKVIHRHLSSSKMLGEWFEPTEEVLSFIENVEQEIKRFQ